MSKFYTRNIALTNSKVVSSSTYYIIDSMMTELFNFLPCSFLINGKHWDNTS